MENECDYLNINFLGRANFKRRRLTQINLMHLLSRVFVYILHVYAKLFLD